MKLLRKAVCLFVTLLLIVVMLPIGSYFEVSAMMPPEYECGKYRYRLHFESIDSATAVITQCQDSSTDIVIPSTLDKYKVTGIF